MNKPQNDKILEKQTSPVLLKGALSLELNSDPQPAFETPSR